MAVLTGANGALTYKGDSVARCRGWSVDIARDALETTCLGVFDREFIAGLRGSSGQTTILYDPTDTIAVGLLNSIFDNDPSPSSVGLILNTRTQQTLSCQVLLTSVGTPMETGQAVACTVAFQVTGAIQGGF
jgi:hypothetical protein